MASNGGKTSGLFLLVVMLGSAPAVAQEAVATYLLNNTLEAVEVGVPPLESVDLLGLNRFETWIVFEEVRRVFHFDGIANPPEQQGGLRLNTTGLLACNNYSVELVFAFLDRPNQWRRILDVHNRQSDYGFYVGLGNHLQVYPAAAGSRIFTNNEFHHIVLSTASMGIVKTYLDGSLEFTAPTTIMNINNPDNPDNLLHFFLDNIGGGYPDEYSSGVVALIRLYTDVLTDERVAELAANPFGDM